MIAFDSWILYLYLRLVNFLVIWISTCLKKKSFSEIVCFFLKSSHFCKIKGNIWYIHDFFKALGNNITVSFLIFDWLCWPFNAAVIACFWYFNNNIFSLITPLAFDNDNVSLIQIFRLHNRVLFNIFLFFCAEVKSGFLHQNFYWKSSIC